MDNYEPGDGHADDDEIRGGAESVPQRSEIDPDVGDESAVPGEPAADAEIVAEVGEDARLDRVEEVGEVGHGEQPHVGVHEALEGPVDAAVEDGEVDDVAHDADEGDDGQDDAVVPEVLLGQIVHRAVKRLRRGRRVPLHLGEDALGD